LDDLGRNVVWIVCEDTGMMTEMDKLIRPKGTNLTPLVMERIKNYIVDNDLGSGDRLPTEKELVDHLGISRNVLREALRSLETIGLIEIRVGDGMYVGDFDYASVMNHISFSVSRTKEELKSFMYAREIIEVGAIEHVIKNVQDEDIARLEEIQTGYERAFTLEDNGKVEMAFHQALLAISGNPVLVEFGRFLERFFIEVLYYRGKGTAPSKEDQHGSLIQALRDRSVARAQEIMRMHILSWATCLELDPAELRSDPAIIKAQVLPPGDDDPPGPLP
jgi:GntR family transcriptional regulator, transcriptional repressor for pyruvate dehydrogenase complex